MPVVRRSSALRCSVLVGVVATWLVGARAIAGEAQLRAPSEALLGSDPLRSQTRVREDGSKLVIGYIYNLYKYDPHGGAQPLPPGVANAAELLEAEVGPFLSNYDVVIQAFIDPADFNGKSINDTSGHLAAWRDGVNGKPGLKALCAKAGIPLMVSIGGGGAPKFVADNPALVEALYSFVTENGYAGIDIDEENTVDTDVYVSFLESLSAKFKGAHVAATGDAELLVSCTIGPLSCCFQSRGICKAAPHIDWAFLMLYDGLLDGSAWSIPDGSTSALWQAAAGQTYCGIQPQGPQQHGIVADVGSGACQFINFALYLNWPADKLVFGMPLYAKSYPAMSWAAAMEAGYKAGPSDPTELLTTFSPGGASDAAGLKFVAPADVTKRVENTLNPKLSTLGVTLDNSGWQSKIMTCHDLNGNSTHVGATLAGIGFWEMSHEDAAHHEVTTAARKAVLQANTEALRVGMHN